MCIKKFALNVNWRNYQSKILDNLDAYLEKKQIHIVAAPGAGKTILGLEIIKRIGHRVLVLAPTITIRDQWIERLYEFTDPASVNDFTWVSKDLKNPKEFTVTTYQALHMFLEGQESQSENDDINTEDAYEEIDIIETKYLNKKSDKQKNNDIKNFMRKTGIKTLVLDEAHHLRNEWWKSLQTLKTAIKDPVIVSLTATPPFDVSHDEWLRYENLCGAIDEEISIPELVKSKDLCPHQDFLFLSPLTQAQQKEFREHHLIIIDFIISLKKDNQFLEFILNHPWISNTKKYEEEICKDFESFFSMIVFINSVDIKIHQQILEIIDLKPKQIPSFNLKWSEDLLNFIIRNKEDDYFSDHTLYIDELHSKIRKINGIENKKVNFFYSKKQLKELSTNINKLHSIVSIVKEEYKNLKDDLRLLILTDFIRIDQFPAIDSSDIISLKKMGVVSIFEIIRSSQFTELKIAILTGSLIVIPRESTSRLIEIASSLYISESSFSFKPLSHDIDYVCVKIEGQNKRKITSLITLLFEAGEIHVLVGTQALLGEGWDAPFLNSLIIASTVSSYILSNQIRGRVIRKNPKVSSKTANIWHLASIDLDKYFAKNQSSDKYSSKIEDDLEKVQKRFKGFEGVYLDDSPIIENGIRRIGIEFDNFDEQKIKDSNETMLNASKARSSLAKKWDFALQGKSSSPHLREKIKSNYEFIPRKTFWIWNTFMAAFASALYCALQFCKVVLGGLKNQKDFKTGIVIILFAFFCGLMVFIYKSIKPFYLFLRNGSIAGSIKIVAQVIINTLHEIEIIKTPLKNVTLSLNRDSMGHVSLSIDGLRTNEKMFIFDAIEELLGPVEKPRYILVRKKPIIGRFSSVDYHSVPYLIAQNKTYVDIFLSLWKTSIGPASINYVHSFEGRAILVKARTKSYASAFQPKIDRLNVWE